MSLRAYNGNLSDTVITIGTGVNFSVLVLNQYEKCNLGYHHIIAPGHQASLCDNLVDDITKILIRPLAITQFGYKCPGSVTILNNITEPKAYSCTDFTIGNLVQTYQGVDITMIDAPGWVFSDKGALMCTNYKNPLTPSWLNWQNNRFEEEISLFSCSWGCYCLPPPFSDPPGYGSQTMTCKNAQSGTPDGGWRFVETVVQPIINNWIALPPFLDVGVSDGFATIDNGYVTGINPWFTRTWTIGQGDAARTSYVNEYGGLTVQQSGSTFDLDSPQGCTNACIRNISAVRPISLSGPITTEGIVAQAFRATMQSIPNTTIWGPGDLKKFLRAHPEVVPVTGSCLFQTATGCYNASTGSRYFKKNKYESNRVAVIEAFIAAAKKATKTKKPTYPSSTTVTSRSGTTQTEISASSTTTLSSTTQVTNPSSSTTASATSTTVNLTGSQSATSTTTRPSTTASTSSSTTTSTMTSTGLSTTTTQPSTTTTTTRPSTTTTSTSTTTTRPSTTTTTTRPSTTTTTRTSTTTTTQPTTTTVVQCEPYCTDFTVSTDAGCVKSCYQAPLEIYRVLDSLNYYQGDFSYGGLYFKIFWTTKPIGTASASFEVLLVRDPILNLLDRFTVDSTSWLNAFSLEICKQIVGPASSPTAVWQTYNFLSARVTCLSGTCTYTYSPSAYTGSALSQSRCT